MSETKPTNPKDGIGATKMPIHLWPIAATYYGCIAMLDGALKYGRSNWRPGGVRASIYTDAAQRHINAWFEGEELDPDSGVPHLAHALACLAIIVDAIEGDNLDDDRMYPHGGKGYRGVVEKLTPFVDAIKKKHADRNPKHFTIEDVKTN